MPSCADGGGGCPTGWSCNTATHLCDADHPLIGCGTDDQCPSGARCCGLTGVCIDAARPELCALPPDGTYTPCTTDDDCAPYNEDKLHFFHFYCDGPRCSGPGGCRRQRSMSDCGGELASVCGCNGTAYANLCWAQAAGTRIAHDGMCP